jgi:hypothetical protein
LRNECVDSLGAHPEAHGSGLGVCGLVNTIFRGRGVSLPAFESFNAVEL